MPHLKHIGLTNFRVFGERTDIALAPLTILTGPNSSGKSSVLKAIQLLQENIADIGHLNFSHGEHKLGNFDMAVNRDTKDKTMVFTLPFEYTDMPEEMYMDWIYEMDMSNPLQYGKLTRLSVCLKKDGHEVIGITPWDKIDIDLAYFHKNRKGANFWINIPEVDLMKILKKHFTKDTNTGYYYDISDIRSKRLYEKIIDEIGIAKKISTEEELLNFVISLLKNIKKALQIIFSLKNDEELTQLFQDEYFNYEKWIYDSFQFTDGVSLEEYMQRLDSYSKEIHELLFIDIERSEEHNLINNFWKLSKAAEDLSNVDILNTKHNIDSFLPYIELDKSNNSIYRAIATMLKEAFELEKSQKSPFKVLQKDNFYFLEAVRANPQRLYTWQSQGTAFNQLLFELVKSNKDWQLDFINHWLKEFGIGKELKISVNEHGIGASITLDNQPLADYGYGVTQFLPILIRICTMVQFKLENEKKMLEDKKILYIEEPETNLHPKLQSKLADMLVDACNRFNLQIIVETHSEYLIRKLQYLTAKKEITPEMTVIHYFYDPKEARPEGEPQVKQINIQTDGRLTGQFGAGFYDETARLMTAILTGETLN